MRKKIIIIIAILLVIVSGIGLSVYNKIKSKEKAIALVTEMRNDVSGYGVRYIEKENVIRLTKYMDRSEISNDYIELVKLVRNSVLAVMKGKKINGVDCELIIMDNTTDTPIIRINKKGEYRK